MAKRKKSSGQEHVRHSKFGARLRAAREAGKITPREVVRDCKIKQVHVMAFERGDFDMDNPYQRGLVESYARYLGVSTAELGGADIRLNRKKQPAPIRKRFRIFNSFVVSQRITFAAAGAFVLLAVGGVTLLARLFLAPPKLVITSPELTQIVEGRTVLVEGHTSSGSEVFVDETPILVSPNGEFSQSLFVRNGLSVLHVKAVNSLGRSATQELVVIAGTD